MMPESSTGVKVRSRRITALSLIWTWCLFSTGVLTLGRNNSHTRHERDVCKHHLHGESGIVYGWLWPIPLVQNLDMNESCQDTHFEVTIRAFTALTFLCHLVTDNGQPFSLYFFSFLSYHCLCVAHSHHCLLVLHCVKHRRQHLVVAHLLIKPSFCSRPRGTPVRIHRGPRNMFLIKKQRTRRDFNKFPTSQLFLLGK